LTAAPGAPLAGLRVWLTRAEPEITTSARVWRRSGAEVIASPTVEFRFRDPDEGERAALAAAAERAESCVVAMVSPRAAEHFVRAFGEQDARGRIWRVAAVGRATAARAVELGLDLRRTAKRALGSVLAEEIVRLAPTTVVLPSSDRRRPEIGQALRSAGIDVLDLVVHRTEPVDALPPGLRELLAAGGVDLITAYSPSALEFVGVIAAAERNAVGRMAIAALGPTTAQRARALGLRVVAAPDHPGEDALIDEVARWWRSAREDRSTR
jgi:uroporphyrinogen-III synthase